MNYVISSPTVPSNTYVLGDGIDIRPVLPIAEMYEAGWGIPHDYQAVMALIMSADKLTPEVHNTFVNLAVFHSFMADDEEVFQHGAERGVKRTWEDSELTFLSDCPTGIDFNRFPLPVPTLQQEEHSPYADECSPRPVNYGHLFRAFCDFERSPDEALVQLHGQICSYVFMRSIWDVSYVELLHRNANMSAICYMAILESMVGEPSLCPAQTTCTICNRHLEQHYRQTWREHIMEQLNRLEEGWGTRYIRPIMKSRDKRHLFAHGAAYSNLLQERRRIYDKRYYFHEPLTEEDVAKEEHLADEENDLDTLERTVRKVLVACFLNQYDLRHHANDGEGA